MEVRKCIVRWGSQKISKDRNLIGEGEASIMANVKLVTVSNQIDADILAEILSGEGIYSLQMTSESGGYMQQTTGINQMGVDIYVTRHEYDAAKEIADMYVERTHCEVNVAEEAEEESVTVNLVEHEEKRQKIKSGIQKYSDAISNVSVANMMIMNRI